MRSAINENRTVQLALLGVLALVGGFLLLRGGGGNAAETGTAGSAGSSPAAADATGTATATTGTAGASTGSAPVAAQVAANTVPGPGLPKGLLRAYRHGEAIVLLVRRAGGIDDALVGDFVKPLRTLPQVKVYVTKARHIARYSWLTQAVDVSELPAIVVLRPRKLSHGTPTAAVSYGFRDADSVLQAVKDALYRGPTHRPYHP
jgi:hypothetical protein